MDAESSSAEPLKGAHHFALSPGTKLFEFEIEEVLGHGGFGITYRALDTTLKETVAVKEFFPNALAGRVSSITVSAKSESDRGDFAAGLKAFLEEARLITRFRHPNIVHVRRFFEMHGTGYIVLDYERGQTLSQRLGGGAIAEAELRGILAGLLAGLEAMHDRAILHRDLKPSNVIIREDGTPVLIDFGAARDFAGRNSRSITAIAAPGYSPPEQYGVGEQQQGPWTDLYSLGAIAYRCVTGTVPIDSLRRLRKDPLVPAATAAAGKYDAVVLGTIDWMLKLEERERPASVAEVRVALASGAPRVSQRRPLLWASAATGIIGLIVIAAAASGPGHAITCGKLGLFCPDQTRTAAAATVPNAAPASATASVPAPAVPTIAVSSRASTPDMPPPASLPSTSTGDTATAPQPPAKPAETSVPLSAAAEAWAATKDTTSVAVLVAYATRYKDTVYGDLAHARIEELKKQQTAALTPTSTSGTPADGANAAGSATAPASSTDATAWEKVRDSKDPERWRAFLEQNPTSSHRAEATTRLAVLEPKVTDCDTLAANPDDPRKIPAVQGVPFWRFDGVAASAACERAVKDFVDAPRLQYQLARAYNKLKKYDDARNWYAKAADSGYPAAMNEIGYLYSGGSGVTKDYFEARRWQTKAADLGYSPAMSAIGILYQYGDGVPKDFDEARKWYLKAADLGYALAMNNIGGLYARGEGVPKDFDEARKWYLKAADLGHPTAMSSLAGLYRNGNGVPKDYAEARNWYAKAAGLGAGYAMNSLASLYKTGGPNLPQDYAEARKWYAKAAELNDQYAARDLGLLYLGGQGVLQDSAEAHRWFAKIDDPWVMNTIGSDYEFGMNGAPKDFTEARTWYSKAAEAGNESAMYGLASLFEEGKGVPRDYVEARKWYRQAADKDNTGAMVKIGLLYESGKGGPQNSVEAHKWFEKAAALGNSNAMFSIGLAYGQGQGAPRDYSEARKWYTRAAGLGNVGAMINLGNLYVAGLGGPRDYAEARRLFTEALNSPSATDVGRKIARENLTRMRR